MSFRDDIDAAVARAEETFARYPERRTDLLEPYLLSGAPRPHPVMYLGRVTDITAGEHLAPPVDTQTETLEERLLNALHGLACGPIRLNPITPALSIDRGTGSLPASFGITLDPALGYAPRGTRTLDDVLAEGMPDLQHSGILAEMFAYIDLIQHYTPAWIRISLPDMQGPFNIAHAVLGDEAFYAPFDEPEPFRQVMELITDFFIAVHQQLTARIDPIRRKQLPIDGRRIAECSVNMLSRDTYLEHVLPHDRRIAEYYGSVAIHPCSGPHVFHATLEHLPHVVYTEAGFIECAFAGAIGVEEALAAIGDRPIILGVGEELPADWAVAERTVQHYFDLARRHPRMTFGFTGMYWKKGSEEQIVDLHRRLDAYWQEHIWEPYAAEQRESCRLSS